MNGPANPPHSEHGAAAVEFLASVIVLFTLIFGCVAVMMAFYTYEVINEYARDASRYAIVHGNGCSYQLKGVATSCSIGTGGTANGALKTYLNNEIFPGINGNTLSISTSYAHGPGVTTCNGANCNGAGDQVTVQVSYPYLYIVPFIPQNSFTMHATSTMVISQ
ncbi:MAG TPA: TadE/TadG family type IV pilus assembly protein [Acidobacteriaceae bacterium]|nr:TadE/TadG family type IV pilus assembly protein [Acidobacteriaceae bacterium]